MAEDPKSNVSLTDMANSFWSPTGLKLPSKELVEAVHKAKLPCLDAFGAKREVVIMTIASEFAFQKMFGIFLQSLANITFPRKDGSTDNLARHVVTNVMSVNSADSCRNVSDRFGAHCANFGNPSFSSGNFYVHSNEFLGIGFTKTATILDALTLNVDVLFLDADQVGQSRSLALQACSIAIRRGLPPIHLQQLAPSCPAQAGDFESAAGAWVAIMQHMHACVCVWGEPRAKPHSAEQLWYMFSWNWSTCVKVKRAHAATLGALARVHAARDTHARARRARATLSCVHACSRRRCTVRGTTRHEQTYTACALLCARSAPAAHPYVQVGCVGT